MKILLPVDGSDHTKRMLSYIAAHDELLGAHHDQVGFLRLRERGDGFGRMAWAMGHANLPTLLVGKHPHRFEHLLGLVPVVVIDRAAIQETRRVRRDGQDCGEYRVLVTGTQQLVVRGDVAQHALRVVASVHGQENLHVHLQVGWDAAMVRRLDLPRIDRRQELSSCRSTWHRAGVRDGSYYALLHFKSRWRFYSKKSRRRSTPADRSRG